MNFNIYDKILAYKISNLNILSQTMVMPIFLSAKYFALFYNKIPLLISVSIEEFNS